MTFEEVVALRNKYPRAVLDGVSIGNQYGILDSCIAIYWPAEGYNTVVFYFMNFEMQVDITYYPDGHLEATPAEDPK